MISTHCPLITITRRQFILHAQSPSLQLCNNPSYPCCGCQFTVRPRIQTTVTAFQPPAVWYTSLQYPPFQMLGPRDRWSNDGGAPGKDAGKFPETLEHVVDDAAAVVLKDVPIAAYVGLFSIPWSSELASSEAATRVILMECH